MKMKTVDDKALLTNFFDKEASDRSCNTQPHGRESQDATSVMLLAVINGTRLKNSACVRGLGWIARRK